MSKKYPHFRKVAKRYREQQDNCRCELCPDHAVARVEFATSYMRGEDEQFRVCQKHLEEAKKGDARDFYNAYFSYQGEL